MILKIMNIYLDACLGAYSDIRLGVRGIDTSSNNQVYFQPFSSFSPFLPFSPFPFFTYFPSYFQILKGEGAKL